MPYQLCGLTRVCEEKPKGLEPKKHSGVRHQLVSLPDIDIDSTYLDGGRVPLGVM